MPSRIPNRHCNSSCCFLDNCSPEAASAVLSKDHNNPPLRRLNILCNASPPPVLPFALIPCKLTHLRSLQKLIVCLLQLTMVSPKVFNHSTPNTKSGPPNSNKGST
ncbi:hypothetical protein A2U01_0062372 [Trifolium medium]|uniref:Uncharacterized protein n=1 Tax=Trifolium medium TaxID=97028 RepID=A0A392RXL8_9FABA|nr:hypothetical protein [Trifolium medium]